MEYIAPGGLEFMTLMVEGIAQAGKLRAGAVAESSHFYTHKPEAEREIIQNGGVFKSLKAQPR